MIRQTLVTVAVVSGLVLAAAAPALAAQPYPVNFHTFDLSSGTPSGLTSAGGSLSLAASGLSSFAYTDPYANVNADGVDGSGVYQTGTW